MKYSGPTHICRILASTLLLSSAPAIVHADITPQQIVNVDFNTTGNSKAYHGINSFPFPLVYYTPTGTYSGTAAGPSTGGTFFNGLTLGDDDHRDVTLKTYIDYSSGPLLASDGVTLTSITVSLSHIFPYEVYQTNGGGEDPSLMGNLSTLFNDYAATYEDASIAQVPSTFTLGGLNVDKTYDLYIYSENDSLDASLGNFIINGQTKGVSQFFSTFNAGFSLNHTYVLFTGLTPDQTGHIFGTLSYKSTSGIPYTGQRTAFNGFQLVETPEPATFSLLFLSISLLLNARRLSSPRRHPHSRHN